MFCLWCSLFPKIPVSLGRKYIKTKFDLSFCLSSQDTSPNEAYVSPPSAPAFTGSEEIQRETAYPDGKVKWELGTWKFWKTAVGKDECEGSILTSLVFSLGWEGFKKWLSPYIFPKWNMEKSGLWWEDHNYNLLQWGCETDYAWSNSGRYPISAFFKKCLVICMCTLI